MNFSISNLAITLIWVVFIGSSFLGSPEGVPPTPAHFSPVMAINILVMPILFFGATPFWARHSPFYHPTLARYVDRHFGEGALVSFLVRLRPLLLFASATVIQGGLGLVQADRSNLPFDAYVISGFFISGGVGFAVAHGLLFLRKAIGVFPGAREDLAIPKPERVSLRQALRSYWMAFIGIALFPTIFFVGVDVLQIPFDYLVLPFFAVSFLAAWPCLSGKAPYSFWFVAMLVYLASGFIAIFLTHAIRLALA